VPFSVMTNHGGGGVYLIREVAGWLIFFTFVVISAEAGQPSCCLCFPFSSAHSLSASDCAGHEMYIIGLLA
jgi:hypothetical protein